jgi:uncharacterized membrane protein YkvA (DUF1232 family)
MFRKEMIILYYALKHDRAPLRVKLPAILSLLYLLSPIDLIPDFIPFFGYLDDILIVPLLLNLSIRLLPADIKEESISKAVRGQKKIKMLIFFFFVFLICWMLAIFFIGRQLLFGHNL